MKKKKLPNPKVPGYLMSDEASEYLGMSMNQFRMRQAAIPSVQVYSRGARLYRIEDVLNYDAGLKRK